MDSRCLTASQENDKLQLLLEVGTETGKLNFRKVINRVCVGRRLSSTRSLVVVYGNERAKIMQLVCEFTEVETA